LGPRGTPPPGEGAPGGPLAAQHSGEGLLGVDRAEHLAGTVALQVAAHLDLGLPTSDDVTEDAQVAPGHQPELAPVGVALSGAGRLADRGEHHGLARPEVQLVGQPGDHLPGSVDTQRGPLGELLSGVVVFLGWGGVRRFGTRVVQVEQLWSRRGGGAETAGIAALCAAVVVCRLPEAGWLRACGGASWVWSVLVHDTIRPHLLQPAPGPGEGVVDDGASRQQSVACSVPSRSASWT